MLHFKFLFIFMQDVTVPHTEQTGRENTCIMILCSINCVVGQYDRMHLFSITIQHSENKPFALRNKL